MRRNGKAKGGGGGLWCGTPSACTQPPPPNPPNPDLPLDPPLTQQGPTSPHGREVLEGGKGRRGGSGTQNFVNQKWHDQIFPFVNFVFPTMVTLVSWAGGGVQGGGGGNPPSFWGVRPF